MKQVFDRDETEVTSLQNPKGIATVKGKRKVGLITSADRGQLVTVVYLISANGNVVPPMLIFSGKNYCDRFVRGRPQSCIAKANPSD